MVPIHIDNLVFRPGGHTVIDGLSATIRAEGITAIVGPNGAGKSVTLRLIDGLLRPDGGSVRFGDRTADRVRRAFVFQKPGLVRGSVRHNAALALMPARLSRREAMERVDAALHAVGLLDRAGDAALRLSGGEQQRLAFARALVGRPELLLLDEPTASLDPSAAEVIETLVVTVAKGGAKVLLVSHNLGQVARLAEDVLVLSKGKAVEHGSARTVLTAPSAAEARAYIKGELPWTPFAVAS